MNGKGNLTPHSLRSSVSFTTMMAKVKKQSPQELYKARKAREEEERLALLPPGLYNNGNTCFLNSVLQGLIATRLLEDLIRFSPPAALAPDISARRSPALTNGRGGEYALERVDGMPLCDIFIRMMDRAWTLRDEKSRSSMSAREVLNRLGAKYDQYLDFRQQDSHELLRHLLDGMYMEEQDIIKKRQPPPPKKQKKCRRTPDASPEPSSRHIPEEERLRPFAEQIFGGKFASILVCEECKHVSHTYEDFMDVSLSIKHEDDREHKKGRFKAFAQRFRRQSALSVPRPQSTPPTPAGPSPGIPVEGIERLSLDRDSSPKRAESDPEPDSLQPNLARLTPPLLASTSGNAGEGLARLGRRVSAQLGMRKAGPPGGEPSPGEPAKLSGNEPDTESFIKANSPIKFALKSPKAPKPSKEESAYLRCILADSAPPASQQLSPMTILRMANGGHPIGETPSASTATAWLKLGSPGHGLVDCLRLFTAVESLDGENMVGCRRCWKIANSIPISRSRPDEAIEDAPPVNIQSNSKVLNPQLAIGMEPRLTASTSALSLSAASSTSTDLTSSIVSSPSTFPSSTDTKDAPSIEPASTGDRPPPVIDTNTFGGRPIPSISTTSPDMPQVPPTPPTLGPSIRFDDYPTHNVLPSDASDDSVSDTPLSTSSSDTSDCACKSESPTSVPRSKQVILRRAYKRYLIARPPPVLVIHLKRFQQVTKTPVAFFGSFKKIDDYVSFPEYLDMRPFIAPRREDFIRKKSDPRSEKGKSRVPAEELAMYRLYAVVVHIGNMLGGHYIVYTALPPKPRATESASPTGPVGSASKASAETLLEAGTAAGASGNTKLAAERKSLGRQWCYISDQTVRLTTIEEVLKAKAYLCFYERI